MMKPDWYADLLNRQGLACYPLVRLALRRLGVEMDADPEAESLKGSFVETDLPPRAGDIIEMESNEPGGVGQHLAVCVDRFNAMHAAGAGVRVDRIAALVRTGRIERRLRARALMGRTALVAGSGAGEDR